MYPPKNRSNQPAERQKGRHIYRVSELITQTKDLLEASFPLLWVEGEISNLSKPRSGHWYFTLKDDKAQVRCAMFRNRNILIRTPPKEGDQVQVRARLTLYVARGDFQIIAEDLQPAGDGALRLAFEQLRNKLQAEGLFEDADKKTLPSLPKRIGVISSATGAALQDIRSTLARRFPLSELVVYPALVQGDKSAIALTEAVQTANRRQECDVLIIGRGGGSLEDLQAFNDETLARAIHACDIPIVSAVGHEVDFTIADFVADVRAATPTAAAELVVPDQEDWLRQLGQSHLKLQNLLLQQLRSNNNLLGNTHERLLRQHPGRKLEVGMQRLDEAEKRLRHSVTQQVRITQQQQLLLEQRLRSASPLRQLESRKIRLSALAVELQHSATTLLQQRGNLLALAVRQLNSISPLRTLERGYAIATDSSNQSITQSTQLKPDDTVHLKLAKGSADCLVTEVHNK